MLWSWFLLMIRLHSFCWLRVEDRHPRMLPVLGLGSLALMCNRNNSEITQILKTCSSKTLESHYSLLVKLKNEEHGFAIRFVEFYF